MGTYLSVIKRSIFLFDHRMVENWNFGHFWKKFDTFWALGASKLVKIFFWKKSKKSKKWWKIFFFIFVCIMFCLLYYVPQTWYNTRKALFTSPCPLLIILKSALFRGLRVYELKFRSKKDNGIIFFQWKLRCCFFQIWYPGGFPKLYFDMKFWNFSKFSKKYKIFKPK